MNEAAPGGALRRWLGALALGAFGIVLALTLGEVALRVAGYPPSATAPDPVVGSRWIPRAAYRWTLEGHSEGRLNRAGWRDRDHALPKPPGTRRVLFLGDSYVQAMEVPLDSAFHQHLERDLSRRGRRVETIAIGRAGFGTTDELLAYRAWGRAYDPDVVALLFILNDWGDNWRWPGPPGMRPYLFLAGDSLRLDTSFVRSPQYRRSRLFSQIKRHSSLATMVPDALARLRVLLRPTPLERGIIDTQGWHTTWNFNRSPAADSVPAMRLTARILLELAREVRRDGRRFVLVVNGACENEAPEFMADRANDPNYDPDKVLRFFTALGREGEFPVVLLTPTFRKWLAEGRPRPAFGEGRRYGHWNSLGHRVAAQAMLPELAAELDSIEATPPPGLYRGQSQPSVPAVRQP